MVDFFDPSSFEDFAHSYLTGHRSIYPGLSQSDKSVFRSWLARMGMVDTISFVPFERGLRYGLELESTYQSWFDSSHRSYRDRLDDYFEVNRASSNFLVMTQSGSKPVIFLHSVPDPYITDRDEQLMFRLRHDFGTLQRDELNVLIHCISDDDNYPNDFWLIPNKERTMLGRGTRNLFRLLENGQRFVLTFTNVEQHATILEGKRVDDRFEVSLTAYFSCSERIPYVDSIFQLSYKLRPILAVLDQTVSFDNDVKAGAEIEVNAGRDRAEGKSEWHGPGYSPFKLMPEGILRRTFNTRSRKIIALMATDPPPFSSKIPWLRDVKPWLVYHGGGTVDSDLDKGRRFTFHLLRVLELETVVLSEVLISRFR